MASLNISVHTPESQNATADAIASYTEGYTFTIRNSEPDLAIAFKTYTQRPDAYTFSPSFGIVMPRSAVAVTIRLRVPAFYCRHLEGNADVSMLALASRRSEARRSLRASRRVNINEEDGVRGTTIVGGEGKENEEEGGGSISGQNTSHAARTSVNTARGSSSLSARSSTHFNNGNQNEEDTVEGFTASEGDSSTDDDDFDEGGDNRDGGDDDEAATARRSKRKEDKERRKTMGKKGGSTNKRSRLERMSSYLRTQIDSGVFKVEIRVISAPIGVGVAETALLSRQHAPERIARRSLERRHKADFVAARRRAFEEEQLQKQQQKLTANNRIGDRSSSGGGGGGGNGVTIFSEKMALAAYDKSTFVAPSEAELLTTVAAIRRRAGSLFDHLWGNAATPHSTHTICCRTLREDIHTFFKKIMSGQLAAIEALKRREAEVAAVVGSLEAEAGALSEWAAALERRRLLLSAGIPTELAEALAPAPSAPLPSAVPAAVASAVYSQFSERAGAVATVLSSSSSSSPHLSASSDPAVHVVTASSAGDTDDAMSLKAEAEEVAALLGLSDDGNDVGKSAVDSSSSTAKKASLAADVINDSGPHSSSDAADNGIMTAKANAVVALRRRSAVAVPFWMAALAAGAAFSLAVAEGGLAEVVGWEGGSSSSAASPPLLSLLGALF